jgi:hypothetical protein
MIRAAMAWQLSLFGLPVDDLAPEPELPQPEPELPLPPAPDPRQATLFDDDALLRCELDAALDECDLAAVYRLDRALRERHGGSPAAAVVAALPADLDALPVAEALQRLEASALPVALRARLRRGLLGRLVTAHGAEAVVAACPATLPEVVATLARRVTPEAGRRLVCDALLVGTSLDALQFGADPDLSDLLAEPLDPHWLASLGALRGLWSAPALGDRPLPEALAEVKDEPGLAFWCCLQALATPGRAEAVVHEARRQMMRLSPELHRLAMRR